MFGRMHRNLLKVVTCEGVRRGGMAEWNFIFDQYKNTEDTYTRLVSMDALTCTTRTWLLDR